MPQTLEDLRSALGVDSGQLLLTNHLEHVDQQFVVERVDQLQTGAVLSVHVPRRRVYISAPPDVKKKAVMWYPGSTLEEIERAIAKTAGFPAGTPIELRDGDATVVLSTTIPNETHLEVSPFVERKVERLTEKPVDKPLKRASTSPLSAPNLTTPNPTPGATPHLASSEARGAGRLQSSPGKRLVNSVSNVCVAAAAAANSRRDRSPPRNLSPNRCRSPLPGGAGSTTPAVHQSAPEEHCVHILAGHSGFVLCLCSVGDILFTGSQDSTIMIWDLNNLQFIGTLPGHKGFVKCLNANYAKKILVSGSQDRTIRVWSLDHFCTVKTLLGHSGAVNAVLILEGIDVLVSGSEDKSIRVWDLNTYELVVALDQAHLGGIFALERFGTPIQVVSGARDRSLKVWDSSTWHVAKTLHPPHYDGVTSIAVAGKHGKFYSGSRDRSIKEWDVGSLTNTMHNLHVHGDWVQALCMSTSNEVLFSGSRDSTVKVWDGTLQCQDILQGHRGPVSALTTVSLGGGMGARLFSASHDRHVRVWRIDQYG